MKTEISATLRRILNDTQAELEHDKSRKSVKRLKHMIRDAVPLISFSSALSPGLTITLPTRGPCEKAAFTCSTIPSAMRPTARLASKSASGSSTSANGCDNARG